MVAYKLAANQEAVLPEYDTLRSPGLIAGDVEMQSVQPDLRFFRSIGFSPLVKSSQRYDSRSVWHTVGYLRHLPFAFQVLQDGASLEDLNMVIISFSSLPLFFFSFLFLATYPSNRRNNARRS